nr:hypothetical protein [uncultured Caldimonas sp.]
MSRPASSCKDPSDAIGVRTHRAGGRRCARQLVGALVLCAWRALLASEPLAAQQPQTLVAPVPATPDEIEEARAASGWTHAAVVVDLLPPETPPAPAVAPSLDLQPRFVGYGWTLRRGSDSLSLSVGATGYHLAPAAREAGTSDPTVVMPTLQLDWRHELSMHSSFYASAASLHGFNDGRLVPLRRARLGFEWAPFKGSRFGIAHGGLRVKFDDQSRMVLKVRRHKVAAYWQARF